MASNYVYLYELDSVRKSRQEIIAGQYALFNAIVYHGETVILTMNQLVDSHAFLASVEDEESFQSLCGLIDCGALRITQFRRPINQTDCQELCLRQDCEENDSGYHCSKSEVTVRTPLQYLYESLNKSDFIHSRLFSKGNTPEARAWMKRAIRYGDPNLITEDANEIFGEDGALLLSRYLRLIMRLSETDLYMLEPKVSSGPNLQKIIDFVCHNMGVDIESGRDIPLQLNSSPLLNSEIQRARQILLDILRDSKDNPGNQRSEWFKRITAKSQLSQNKRPHMVAVAIVSICYLTACELGIKDLKPKYACEDSGMPIWELGSQGYGRFFLKKLNEHLNSDHSFLKEGTSEPVPEVNHNELPDWKFAERHQRSIYNADQAVPALKASFSAFSSTAKSFAGYVRSLEVRQLFKGCFATFAMLSPKQSPNTVADSLLTSCLRRRVWAFVYLLISALSIALFVFAYEFLQDWVGDTLLPAMPFLYFFITGTIDSVLPFPDFGNTAVGLIMHLWDALRLVSSAVAIRLGKYRDADTYGLEEGSTKASDS